MLGVYAKIDGGGKIKGINSNDFSSNNISAEMSETIGQKFNEKSPLLLGVTAFKEQVHFVDNTVPYYISDVVSDENGNLPYTSSISVTFNTTATLAFIYFGAENYPKSVTISGAETVDLDSPILIIPLKKFGGTSIYFAMDALVKPNRPLVILGVRTFTDVPSGDMVSLSFSGQDRSDPSLPSWGIKSNSGYLEMFDTYGIIENMRNLGVLVNSQINIYFNAGNRTEQIGGFYVNNANKDRKTFKTKIEYQDILPSWENIEIKSQNPTPIVYSSLWSVIDYIFSNLSIDDINYTSSLVEEHLRKINVPYLYYEDGSLWGTMAKICEVSGCYIYCDKEGIPTMNYNEGN